MGLQGLASMHRLPKSAAANRLRLVRGGSVLNATDSAGSEVATAMEQDRVTECYE
jgi:hypothetical protein